MDNETIRVIVERLPKQALGIGDFLPTIVAALVGALVALIGTYYVQRRLLGLQRQMRTEENSNEQRKKQRSAVNQTIFLVYYMQKNLEQYKKDIVDPAVETGQAWLTMEPSIQGQVELRFPHDDLLFILDTQYVNLYAELLLEEQKYRTVMDIINRLNAIRVEKLQPKMEELGYGPDSIMSMQIVERQLGPTITFGLKSLTRELIRLISEYIESFSLFHNKFHDAMQEYFPNENIIPVRSN